MASMDDLQKTADAWVTAQRKLWDSVAESITTLGAQQAAAHWAEVGRQSFELWETAVRRAFDAQAEWTRIWADAITESPTTPEFFAEQVQRIQRLTARWTEAQGELYQRSIAELKERGEGVDEEALKQATERVVKNWNEAVEQAGRAQQAWLESFASAGAT